MKPIRLVLAGIFALCLLGVLAQAATAQVAEPQSAPAQVSLPNAVPEVRSFAYQGANGWWACNDGACYDAPRVSGRMVSGDFNGDGLDEIAALYDYGETDPQNPSNSQIHVWQSTESSFSNWATWWAPGPKVFQSAAVKDRFVSGDFNGDGIDDLAGMYDYGGSKATLWVWLSTGTSFTYGAWWQCGAGCYDASAATGRMVAGDFNGDGKDDIAAMYAYGALHVWLSTGSEFQRSNENDGWWRNGLYDPGKDTGRMVAGDFNRDGFDDIAALHDYGNNKIGMNVWVSTGGAFVYQGDGAWWPCMSTDCYPAGQVSGRVVSADFNGDGRDDVAALYDYGGAESTLHVWLSAGGAFNYQSNSGWWQSGAGQYSAPSVTGRLVAGDFDGDQRADIAAMYDYDQGRARLHTWLARGRSVYFLALSDVHAWTDFDETKPKPPELRVFDNLIAKLPPTDVQSPYRGVIVAGDLINQQGHNWFGATTLWNGTGVCTRCTPNFANDGGAYEGRIWPSRPHCGLSCLWNDGEYIYDGWGNHDMSATAPDPLGIQITVWQDLFETLKSRVRVGQYPASEGGHYSWDWNGIHFVQLNLLAGNARSDGGDGVLTDKDPHQSLTFLQGDLAAHAEGKPVVIVQHAAPDNINSAEESTLADTLRPYRVVAFVFGHTHGTLYTDRYSVTDNRGISRTYNTVHPGSLYPEYLNWSDIALTEGACSEMTIQGYKDANPSEGKVVIQFPDLDKPISTAQAQRVQGGNCPTRVTLTAVDPPDSRNWGCSSGVREIQYQLNGTAEDKWKTYKDTPPLIVPAGTTVYYRAVDLAGGPSDSPYRDSKLDNVEDWQQLRIDTCHTYLPTIRR